MSDTDQGGSQTKRRRRLPFIVLSVAAALGLALVIAVLFRPDEGVLLRPVAGRLPRERFPPTLLPPRERSNPRASCRLTRATR